MKLGAWLQAARPLAQVNIAIPLLLGEALGFAVTGAWSWTLFGLTHVAGILDHLFIVFANDVADEEGDRGNTTFNEFSGGSRVLVDGKLEAQTLRRAAALMGILLIGLAATTAFAWSRPLLLVAWGLGIALLWAYSFAPSRLSYRGYGEVTQGLGLGVVLPVIGFYAMSGSIDILPWKALLPMFAVGLAGNINTALPDSPADAECGKRTWPVRYGDRRARKHSLQILGLAAAATPFVLPLAEQWVWAAVEVGPAVVLIANWKLGLDKAEPTARDACRRFVFLNGLVINLLLGGWALALGLGLAHFG